MGERDAEIIFYSQGSEDAEEANAIRSTGKSENKRISMLPEALFCDEVLDTTNQSPRLDGKRTIVGAVR